jgi:DHA3 family macrolide efflux protein-like MFS transporter
MRTFIILWLGQMVSSIGSSMTYFALTLWVWQKTESVTAIALITVFFQIPQIGLALVSGIIVDRFSRKQLLLLSDIVTACCSLLVGVLYATEHLQLGYLYAIASFYGCFSHIQTLTYTTTIPLIVPQQHHTRASSLGAMINYSSAIISPALAGSLYPTIGLLGITLIDQLTFAIAMLSLLGITIPPVLDKVKIEQQATRLARIWHELTFGFRYIASNSTLLTTMVSLSLFAFAHQLGETLYEPMILARTNNNTQLLGLVSAAGGIGGVVGGIILSVWGGFRRQIHGILSGFIGVGVSRLFLGLGRLLPLWIGAQFCASLPMPMVFSSYMAIWYVNVAPELQGRVFAADYLMSLIVGATASLMAGFLADQIFEPFLQSGGFLAQLFSPLFGNGTGAGISLLYSLSAAWMVLIGGVGYMMQRVRQIEEPILETKLSDDA